MAHKIGLALGGGGARGSYQIGVIKALMDAGIMKQVDIVAGTSIGAIHALMVMAGVSYERMYELWTSIDNSMIFGGKSRLKLDKQGIFSLQSLHDVLEQAVTLKEVRESRMQAFVTASKINKKSLIDQVLLHRMEKVIFNLNEINDPHQAVLASSSIPIIFGPDEFNDETYVDGGAVEQIPVQTLIDQGCDIIIAIPAHLNIKPRKYKKYPVTIINICQHMLFDLIGLDVINFNIEKVPERVDYGFKLGQYMLARIERMGIYDKRKQLWHVKNEFQYVYMTRDDEKNCLKQGEQK